MYNTYVEQYCKQYNLRIQKMHGYNLIYDGTKLVGRYSNGEKYIDMFDDYFSEPKRMRKGDLMLYMMENDKAH